MKILIIGDIHIGSSFHLGKTDPVKRINTRLIDYTNTLNYLIDRAIELDVAHVIFLGDLFRNPKPGSDELNCFAAAITRLIDNNIKIIIVIGNHDRPVRNGTYHSASIFNTLKTKGVNIVDAISGFTLPGKNDKIPTINVIGIPFQGVQMMGASNAAQAVKSTRAHFDKLLATIKAAQSKLPTIVVGHCLVEGVNKFGKDLTGAEKEPCLPVEMFGNIDITLMGHVHNSQVISKDPFIFGVGSMERVDFGEAGDNKKAVVLTTVDGSLEFETIDIPCRNLYNISIDLINIPSDRDSILVEINRVISNFDLLNSIAKVVIVAPQASIPFIVGEDIKKILLSKGAYYCAAVSIVKIKNSTTLIKEGVSTTDALKKVAEKNIADEDFRNRVVKKAQDIVKDYNASN